MMKRLLALLLTLGIFAGPVHAHNGMQHIMGTVTAITGATITVKATNATMQTIAFTRDTKYLRGSSPVTLKDIKVGDHVVIHATKKSDQLTAAEVRIGAMKAKSMAGDMSGIKMDKKE